MACWSRRITPTQWRVQQIDCFCVPPTDSLYDVIGMDLDGRDGGMWSGRALLGRVDVDGVVVRLLDVLEAFAQRARRQERRARRWTQR